MSYPENIYDAVEQLETEMTSVLAALPTLQAAVSDSGWNALPLSEGVEAYATTQIPQYRKIGKVVFIRGAVKGITATGTIATLPAGYRPAATMPFVQNTSQRSGPFTMVARYTINNAGAINLESVSDGATLAADKWFPIATSFTID